MLVLFCGITWTPCNLGLQLLQDRIESILKGCMGVAIIISAVLRLVLLKNANPMQFWLCGLVGCSITMEYQLWLWSLNNLKYDTPGDCLPQKCTAKWQAFWQGVRGLQFTSVQCWLCIVWSHEPHATWALWLGWMYHYYKTGLQAFWIGVRGLQFHQCSVSVRLVGL